jgi:hypothetical protein
MNLTNETIHGFDQLKYHIFKLDFYMEFWILHLS